MKASRKQSKIGLNDRELSAIQKEIDRVSAQLTGVKHDSGKDPYSLVPKELIAGAARALAFGAERYGKNNFKGGMKWSRVIDAALRHLYAYAHGENNDPDSGLCHIDHAAANVGMLLYYIKNEVGADDR
jgi:hypothetical protein